MAVGEMEKPKHTQHAPERSSVRLHAKWIFGRCDVLQYRIFHMQQIDLGKTKKNFKKVLQ